MYSSPMPRERQFTLAICHLFVMYIGACDYAKDVLKTSPTNSNIRTTKGGADIFPTVDLLTTTSIINATNESAVAVSGACSADGLPVSLSGVVFGKAICTSGTFSLTHDFSPVADGDLTILADFSDASGNPALQASKIVTKDTELPSVDLSKTAAYINKSFQSKFLVSGNCSEEDASIQISGAVQDVALCQNGIFEKSLDYSSSLDGSIVIYADLSDAAGNTAIQASKTVVKDIIPPSVDLSTTTETFISGFNKDSFTISGSCSDNGQTVTVTGPASGTTKCAKHTFSLSFDFNAIDDGPIKIYADLSDAAGNVATQTSKEVTKDTLAPTIDLGSAIVTATTHALSPSVTDVSSISSYLWSQLSGPGTLTFADPQSKDTTVAANQNGAYIIRLTVTDAADNTASADLSFTWNGWIMASGNNSLNCGIKYDKSLWCWGLNNSGQVGDGTTTNRYQPTQIGSDSQWNYISAGGYATACAIKNDQSLWCWGSNAYGTIGDGTQTNRATMTAILPGTMWQMISTYDFTTCGIKTDGTLWCWGYNQFGQVANGNTTTPIINPTQVGANTNWVSVTAGYMPCGMNSNHEAFCWGRGNVGGLGNGVVANATAPAQVGVAETISWASISAYLYTACGISVEGKLYCWGSNNLYQVGDGTNTNRSSPVQLGSDTDWAQVVVGNSANCALKQNHTRWCWGSNSKAVEFGDDTSTSKIVPTQVDSGTHWTTLISSFGGIKDDGNLWIWGINSKGQRGDGSHTGGPIVAPQQLTQDSTWSKMTFGYSHICAIKSAGSLWCFGDNSYGQLGNGNTLVSGILPGIQIGVDTTWSDVGGGYLFTCGLKQGGTIWCWGLNNYGQVGDGTTTDRNAPTQVGTDTDWAQLGVGAFSACGRKTNGTVWCWGRNNKGMLGNSTNTNSSIPVQVIIDQATYPGATDNTWTNLKNGWNYSCALQVDASLWCWGGNDNGQLGTGNTTHYNNPKKIVAPVAAWSSVAPSDGIFGWHTCAIDSSQLLYCWGLNSSGQLGLSDTTNRSTPTLVHATDTWLNVKSSMDATCAKKTDGSFWCFGANSSGQLADGTTTNKNSPVAANISSDVDSGNFFIGMNLGAYIADDGTLWGWGDNANYGPDLPYPTMVVVP